MRFWLAAAIGALVPTLVNAQPAVRPVVGELFTSEGCSSCPPADAKISDLARTRPDLLLLTFHVTYWNNLGWHDPYSFDAATERQRRYVTLGVSPDVYTPALVVDGKLDAVGSDAAAVDQTLRRAELSQETAASVDVHRGSAGLTISVGAGTSNGTLLLIGYDRLHQTPVGRGENSGRTLEETNIVRSMSVLGTWSGDAVRLQVPYPAGQDVAVLLQRDDGHIVGAAVAHASSRASWSPRCDRNRRAIHCAWVSPVTHAHSSLSGSSGKPPACAGTDFIIVRDGKIAAVYLFFDELPWAGRYGVDINHAAAALSHSLADRHMATLWRDPRNNILVLRKHIPKRYQAASGHRGSTIKISTGSADLEEAECRLPNTMQRWAEMKAEWERKLSVVTHFRR
jgi:hypothetical protein